MAEGGERGVGVKVGRREEMKKGDRKRESNDRQAGSKFAEEIEQSRPDSCPKPIQSPNSCLPIRSEKTVWPRPTWKAQKRAYHMEVKHSRRVFTCCLRSGGFASPSHLCLLLAISHL